MILENLFPIPVGFFEFEEGLTPEQEQFLIMQEQRKNDGNTSSVDKYLLKNMKLENLTTFIETCLHEYLTETISPKNDAKLRITQSWLNWTNTGQYHHKHAHPNSFISGVFYVNANKESDKIYFYNDEYKQIKLIPNNWNVYNSDSWWFPVGTNTLVFFPSSLPHMVQTVEGKDTRISLSFNTFPVGYIGDEDELTALHLE